LQNARLAVESTCRPVKIEMDIVEGKPGPALGDASLSARLVCIGAASPDYRAVHRDFVGLHLASSTRCSLAIVQPNRDIKQEMGGWIMALLGSSADEYDVLQQAIEEARRRQLSLRVVMRRGSGPAEYRARRACRKLDATPPGIDTQIVHSERFIPYVRSIASRFAWWSWAITAATTSCE
jgi:hypothetical protein